MNKKILFSGMSILASLTLLAGSAYAAFDTTATASDNTFSSGTDNLTISLNNLSDFHSTIGSPFTGSNIAPGYNHVFTFYLKNENTSTDNLNVSATFTGTPGDTALENALSTHFSCNDNGNITTPSAFSVTSMRGGSVSLGTIKNGDTASCTLTVTLPLTADTQLMECPHPLVFSL